MVAASFEPWSERLARRRRDSTPWLILPSDPRLGNQHRSVSYADLYELTRRIAQGLSGAGAEPGARVVVVADNSAEACLLLLAVLAVGMVAVPVPPQGLSRRDQAWADLLSRVCEECSPVLIVGRASALPAVPPMRGTALVEFERLVSAPPRDSMRPVPGDALAILQYTSGTTSKPRGIELTHDNVLHNVCSIARASGARRDDVVVSWLPLFHDMGLIAVLLHASYAGAALVLMSPRAFYLRPQSWLWAISRFRGTCTAAPNSGYQFCTSRVASAAIGGLDLSSLRVACCGAELVQHRTVADFIERFAPYGFRPECFWPVYGLAEDTTAATFPPQPRPPLFDWVDRDCAEREGAAISLEPADPRARAVAALGRPLDDQELRVVDAVSGRVLPERAVGNIELRGPCVTRGYWRAPELTRQHLKQSGWLMTGDRGYVAGGELYLTGREKHIIKRAGRAFDADDVAAQIQGLHGVRAGAVAVFGVPDAHTGSEALVAIVETELRAETERRALTRAIAERVQAALSIRPDRIVLAAPGSVPRTTSGKIRSQAARARHLADADAQGSGNGRKKIGIAYPSRP